MSVNCNGLPLTRILICPNLGSGSGGATASARQMLSGANILNYQLYSDSARSVVWGSYAWGSRSEGAVVELDFASQRFLNIALGTWIAASPFLLDGGSGMAAMANVAIGLALIGLSLPRGARSEEHYGGWDRAIV